MLLCHDIYDNIVSFFDNIKDVIIWKSVCKYNYSHDYYVTFMVSKFYNGIRTCSMKLSNPNYSNLQIQNLGYFIHTLYADRLMVDDHFQYMYNITELHCRYAKLTDCVFDYLPNLKRLYCDHCNSFTDIGLSKTNLEILDCGYWESRFTDQGLLFVQKTLIHLYCRYNINFTDNSLKYLTNLEVLHVNSNVNFTDSAFYNLKNLYILYCGKNNNITDLAFINLNNLLILSCDKNNNITDEALRYIPKLKALFTYCNNTITDNGLKYLSELVVLNCKNSKTITSGCLKYLKKLQDLSCSFEIPETTKICNPSLHYINTRCMRSIDILI